MTVTITGIDMFGNPVSATVDTDADGHFVFIVPEGDYTLTYSTPDVLAIDPTLQDATTPTSIAFHAYPGEDWHPVFDFGVDNSGKIGDLVWNDADASGTKNGSEIGLPNVTVDLFQDLNNNNLWDTGEPLVATHRHRRGRRLPVRGTARRQLRGARQPRHRPGWLEPDLRQLGAHQRQHRPGRRQRRRQRPDRGLWLQGAEPAHRQRQSVG